MKKQKDFFQRSVFFLLTLLVMLFIGSCVRVSQPTYTSYGSVKAKCNTAFGAYIQFCNSRRVLSNQVQDGSLIAIEKSNGKVIKAAAYYDSRYTLCLPKTYKRYFYYGEPVKVVVLRCGYSGNKPYCIVFTPTGNFRPYFFSYLGVVVWISIPSPR
jgi:CDGSH-type Zn-finger protein